MFVSLQSWNKARVFEIHWIILLIPEIHIINQIFQCGIPDLCHNFVKCNCIQILEATDIQIIVCAQFDQFREWWKAL